ncbi:ABC transporter permease [Vagococcus vulneris]|uniref:ABC transmembrane type-1 domain-containing protein n=1 Tax=Vagococcus vulneris TaxID=1977869 RepID=A0A430A011_9ENTE|nr:ABC transporter permease [Vagococcus vulneris]RST99606.1 hypothetical protein CBF37_04590 [Vagococcus vulneris]
MKKFIIKRLLVALIIFLGVSIFIFIILQLQPGNPYLNSLNPNISQEQTKQILMQKGYYDPLPVKFIKWFKGFITFDFGYSIQYKEPVVDVILSRLPKTLMLTIPSLFLSLIFSFPIGMYMAYKPSKFVSKLMNIINLAAVSLPTFLIAILLIKWLSFDLNLFPISGTGELEDSGFQLALYSVLPIITLTIMQSTVFIRYIRGYFQRELTEQYYLVAQGFGMTRWQALVHSIFPTVLPQMITLIFMEIPALFSGALITETVFVWPGIGKLNYDAVTYRDYPLIMGLLSMTVGVVLLSNLAADILGIQLNPLSKKEMSD